jgi:single-strand DNA-binding protein
MDRLRGGLAAAARARLFGSVHTAPTTERQEPVVNIVAIVGNVASEPELRHTSQGRAICSFRVAVSRIADAQQVDFFNVVAWERRAEICNEYLDIGRRIAVQGRMHCRVHDDAQQVRRTNVEIVACRVELLSPNPRADRSTSGAPAEVAR